MEISTGYSLHEKLHILADAAKYDVACTSSGVDRLSWQFKSVWDLSQFFSGWPLYFLIKGATDESLCLRLQILYKQSIQ